MSTHNISERMGEMGAQIDSIFNTLGEIKDSIEKLGETLEKKYVQKVELEPLTRLVYGLVAAVVAIAIPLIVGWLQTK